MQRAIIRRPGGVTIAVGVRPPHPELPPLLIRVTAPLAAPVGPPANLILASNLSSPSACGFAPSEAKAANPKERGWGERYFKTQHNFGKNLSAFSVVIRPLSSSVTPHNLASAVLTNGK